MLVCPHCGNDQFEVTLPTTTKYTYRAFEDGGLYEYAQEQEEGGDEGDIDTLECNDCGSSLDQDDLVTGDVYDGIDNDDEEN